MYEENKKKNREWATRKREGEVGVELKVTGMVVKYFARTPHTQLAIRGCINGLIKML